MIGNRPPATITEVFMKSEYLVIAFVALPFIFFAGIVPALWLVLSNLPLNQDFSYKDCFVYASPLLMFGVASNIVKALHAHKLSKKY